MSRPLVFRRPARVAALLALAVGLTGCVDDDPRRTGPGGPAAELEQQRSDVRALAGSLLGGVEAALEGRTTQEGGRFQGCTSAAVDRFADFQYIAEARVDAGPGASRPYVAALAALDLGSPVTEAGRTELRGQREGLDVVVTERETAGEFVLVRISGPCIDVPEDESDDWLRREADDSLR